MVARCGEGKAEMDAASYKSPRFPIHRHPQRRFDLTVFSVDVDGIVRQ
jgi:hypothetical protein